MGGGTLPEPSTWNTGGKAGGVGRVGWGCCLPCPKTSHFSSAHLFARGSCDRSVSEVSMIFVSVGERHRLWRASTGATQTSVKSCTELCWCVRKHHLPPGPQCRLHVCMSAWACDRWQSAGGRILFSFFCRHWAGLGFWKKRRGAGGCGLRVFVKVDEHVRWLGG